MSGVGAGSVVAVDVATRGAGSLTGALICSAAFVTLTGGAGIGSAGFEAHAPIAGVSCEDDNSAVTLEESGVALPTDFSVEHVSQHAKWKWRHTAPCSTGTAPTAGRESHCTLTQGGPHPCTTAVDVPIGRQVQASAAVIVLRA